MPDGDGKTPENLEDTRIHSQDQTVRVLIADPDRDVFEQIKSSQPKDKYDFSYAGSSWGVIETLMSQKFDILIADIDSRGENFLETISYTQKHYPLMIQIVASAKNDVEAAVKSMRNGAYDFIVKPLTKECITRCLVEASEYSRQLLVDTVALKPEISEVNLHALNILPDYTPIRVIGSGASGIVIHLRRNRINYALKILHQELLESNSAAERFSREAGLLARIDHPNVVRVFESGVAKDTGTPFILMEFIEGSALSELIQKHELSVPDGYWILRQAVNALRTIHASDIIHRDIKPGNIMVKENKQIKLMDFGLAKTVDSNLTMGQKAIGTPAYMAPEVFTGRLEYSDRYDIFALGVSAYEVFTGQKPFQGDTFAKIADAIIKARPVNPRHLNPSLPTGIEQILGRMLAKSPHKRPSAAELCVMLEEYSAHGADILNRTIMEKLGLSKPWA
jgi:tRNA A-37 threonylcarbamoyl transferase component Bud32/ActR/RegA family two-component response regulator